MKHPRQKSTTVRISAAAHEHLKELAKKTGEPIQTLLMKALEIYRRQSFLLEVNKDYLEMNEAEKRSLGEERRIWDAANLDGLEKVDPRVERKKAS